MNGCIYRTRSDLCMKFTTEQSISFCVGKKCPDRKESNADRIRSMTNEELARFLQGVTLGIKSPLTDWVDWLKQEATE